MRGHVLEVNAIEVVLLHHVRDGLDEGRPVGSRTNACGEIARTCPAAHGDNGFHILNGIY